VCTGKQTFISALNTEHTRVSNLNAKLKADLEERHKQIVDLQDQKTLLRNKCEELECDKTKNEERMKVCTVGPTWDFSVGCIEFVCRKFLLHGGQVLVVLKARKTACNVKWTN
jgi:hypothetical protein